MQYIILDMEWNQLWPGSYSAKKALPSPMRGEIVQIGAVRMTQEQQIADEFQILIRPKYFKKMNRKVASLLRMNVLLLAIVFVLFSFLMHSVWEVAFLVTLFFIGFNILEATLPGLISRTAPKADKGLALGIYNTTQSLSLIHI